jgi:hypothetical protein
MRARFGWEIASSLALVAAPFLSSCDQSAAQDVQGSHIAANVPDAGQFDVLLVRDLSSYFASKGMSRPQVTYKLLRTGPTQSGVAYPKYYLWVSAVSDRGVIMSGAARVAAIERLRFEITDFVSRDDVLQKPDALASIFPAALLPAIRASAATP